MPTKGDAAPNLTAEQRFGISFQTYRQLGKVATALSEKGAAAVVFVQVRDATGLTDCLSTLLPSTQQPAAKGCGLPVGRLRITRIVTADYNRFATVHNSGRWTAHSFIMHTHIDPTLPTQ
ncbi:MAG: hypothetical protein K8J09_07160 [Planctomycetes bacterium]|nr:hypothetical protein [Planctomycetota bacterium]